ncbi:hypothetical protein F2Q69_00047602 [Brassica cretica]|uniref:Uncharacterized protein n=1 Tax=Brassica cretica TaxID=69181 RepID=A0A8S9PLD3_BRACR|nr:hypothetical protein F2Q69_00047602 [Brassica cretica]
MMKALKDISKNQKKSTSTRAPVAETFLFISKKSKGKSETHIEELKDFSDSLPTFDEYDEEPIESLMIFFEEEPLDYPHQGPRIDTRKPLDDDLGPIFDEEDEPGPVFDEEATSITSIEKQVQPQKSESIYRSQQPEIWRCIVVQTGYLGDASNWGSVQQ